MEGGKEEVRREGRKEGGGNVEVRGRLGSVFCPEEGERRKEGGEYK